VQCGSDDWHAMPGVEQNTPLALLPQERQPSVHAVHEAFAPFANSSSRGSALSFDTGAVTRGAFECLMTSGRSAARVGCVPSVKPQRPVIATTAAITAIRNLRGIGCSLDIRFPIIGSSCAGTLRMTAPDCGVMSRYRCKILTRWPARRKARGPMLSANRRAPS
jgi:hypothetical protein